MKQYHAETTFADPAFPLAVSRSAQRSSMVPHIHDFWELVLVAGGHTIHLPGNRRSYALIRGDCFAIAPGEVHAYADSKNLVLYNIALNPALFTGEMNELRTLPGCSALLPEKAGIAHEKIHLPPDKRDAAEKSLKTLLDALTLRPPCFRLKAKIAMLDFLLTTGAAEPMSWEAGSETSPLFAETLIALENTPERDFDLARLARSAGMSVPAYTRKFRSTTGTSPLDYCILLRLEKVCRMLEEADASISEIAVRCGFCDGAYLTRVFHRRYGMTPGRYRRARNL